MPLIYIGQLTYIWQFCWLSVCDGHGGHRSSTETVKFFQERLPNAVKNAISKCGESTLSGMAPILDIISTLVHQVDSRCQEMYPGEGTTLASILIIPSKNIFVTCHVGDSRVCKQGDVFVPFTYWLKRYSSKKWIRYSCNNWPFTHARERSIKNSGMWFERLLQNDFVTFRHLVELLRSGPQTELSEREVCWIWLDFAIDSQRVLTI